MKDLLAARRQIRKEGGFTLAELIVASGVGTIIAGTMMLLLLQSAKEQYRGTADANVEQAAGELEHQVIRLLRTMSATEGVVFTSLTTNNDVSFHGYQRIIVARGPTPDFPREEIRFDALNQRAVYDPNRAVTNNEQVLLESRPSAYVLRNLCFFPSLKEDGTPDNSLVNVIIEVDDNGSSRRHTVVNPAHIERTFAVKMRNN